MEAEVVPEIRNAEDWRQQERLAQATRALVNALVLGVPYRSAASLADDLEALVPELRADRGVVPWYLRIDKDVRRSAFSGGADEVVAGGMWARFNPISVPLGFRVRGDLVEGHTTVGAAHSGPPGRVHGGVIATMLDHAMGAWLTEHERPSFTATLTIDYQAPTPLGEPLTIRGGAERDEGRKTWMWATIEHGGVQTVRGRALFIAR